jgi:HEAT repeat protein
MRVVRAAGNIGVEKNEDVAGTLKAFVEQGPYYFREERIVSGKPSDFLPVLVEAAKALGKMGEPAKGIFLPLLASPDEFIQKLAVIGLGETRSAKVVGPLLGLKRRSQDKNLQALIIQALGKIRSERVIRPLIESMKDDDLWIHAFYSLLAQGDSATTQLVNTLVDELIRLNNGSGEFLIRLIGEVAVEPLIDRLNQEVPDNTKRQILPMLVSIADPRVKNYLENLMVNPPEWLTPELQKSVEFAIE